MDSLGKARIASAILLISASVIGAVVLLAHNRLNINLGSNVQQEEEKWIDVARIISDLKNSRIMVTTEHPWDVWYKKTKAIGCEFIEMHDWTEFLLSVKDDNPFIIYLDEEVKVIWYWYTYNAQGLSVYVVYYY